MHRPPAITARLTSRRERLRLLRRIAAVSAVVIAAMSVAALLGHLVGSTRLVQPLRSMPPMPVILAIAMACNAAALWALVDRRPTLHLIAGALAVGAALNAVWFRSVAPFDAGASINFAGAALGLTCAIALLLTRFRDRIPLAPLVLTIAGFVVIALCLTVVGARFAGISGVMGGRPLLATSLQTLVGAFLIGTCFVALLWSEGVPSTETPTWLAATAGIASAATVVMLWGALDARETAHFNTETLVAADGQTRSLRREIAMSVRSLQRCALRAANGAALADQRSDLAALTRDLPGMIGGLRVTSGGNIIAAIPDGLAHDDPAVEPLARARSGVDTLRIIPFSPRTAKLAIVAPVCRATRCDGAVIGLFDAQRMLASLLPSAGAPFTFSVLQDGVDISQSPPRLPAHTPARVVPLGIGELGWSVAATPTAATAARLRSPLPELVLFLGLLVSAMIPVLLRLAHLAWRGARLAERTALSAAVERATDGLWEWNVTTGRIERSGKLWRHLGYDPDQVDPAYASWIELIHKDDRPLFNDDMVRHLNGHSEAFETEYRVRDRHGAWHVVVDRGRVVERSPNGAPVRVLGISADVTEARRRDEAHAASDRRFRTVFDSGFQFVLLLDADGRMLEINRATRQTFETADTALGHAKAWESLWWSTDAEAGDRLREAVERARTESPVFYDDEFPSPAGPPIVLEIAVSRIADAAEDQFVVEARDVSSRRRSEAAHQEVDTLTAMGRIAAKVAHEINNPLAGIQYAFLLIKDAVPTSHPQHAYVGAIEREIGRIAAVTRQLYETYRAEPEITADTSLATVVGDAISFMNQSNKSSGVRIVADLTRAPSIVRVSGAVLRQVVYNLVQNAMDASPAGATVTVAAQLLDHHLEVRVADAGPGVPVELRQRIFEPFFSTKDKRSGASGMGLGLALVRRSVLSAGGQIRVDASPTGGAEFIVTLPTHSGN